MDINIEGNPDEKELDKAEHIAWIYQPDSAYFIDIRGRYLRVNVAKAKHWNTTPEAMKNKTDFDYMSWTDALKIFYSENSIWETSIPIKDEIEEITNPDGTKRYNSVSKKLVWLKSGKIIGIYGISRDITDRIIVQQELARAREIYLKMIRITNHDIQGPLSTAIAMLERAIGGRYGKHDESVKAALEDIDFELGRIKNTTSDYLNNLSYLIDGAGIGEKPLLDMRMEVIEPVLENFQKEFDRRGIQIDNKFRAVPIGRIRVPAEDRKEVQIIFNNLFGNVCKKFSPEDNGKISFGVKYEFHNGKEYPILNVWDSGDGVPEENRSQLFEPYKSETSTGVGLHTCREIARSHGGDIWYEHTGAGHPNFMFRYWRSVE